MDYDHPQTTEVETTAIGSVHLDWKDSEPLLLCAEASPLRYPGHFLLLAWHQA